MAKKVLALLMVVAVAGVALGSLWLSAPGEADASGHSATRAFSSTSVAPGETVTVTIVARDYGNLGRIVETVPDGFTTSGGDQTVTIRLLAAGPRTETYTVTASDNPGSHSFSGTLADEGKDIMTIGGPTTVTITAPPSTPDTDPSATRSFSAASVDPGGTVTVTIRADNYGGLGRVVETLPSGFTSPDASGQTVTLRLLQEGPQTRSYTVTASDNPGSYTFSGVLESEDKSETQVLGPSTVTVNAPPGPSARRSFSLSPVAPGGTVTVTIRADNYGGLGRVVETLPSGFTSPDASGQTVTLRLLQEGPQTRSYTVTASDNLGSYTFSGVLESEDKSETQVLGPSSVTVRAPSPPRPRPPANNPPTFPSDMVTRMIAENSPPGTNVGEPVTATDPDGDTLTYTLGGADVADFRIDSASGQITVGPDTSLDFETQSMYALAVTASDGSISGATSVIINLTDVDEAPPADPCVNDLGGFAPDRTETLTGTWAADCASENRLGRYANFFSFTLEEATEVTIELTSDEDTYLYLLEGMGRDGMALHENDDIVPATDTNSRIQETLAAGTYTIEATTYSVGQMGSFTLTVSGLGDVTTPMPPPGPMPTDDPCRQTLPGDDTVTGDWASDCESAVGARGYARYYTFTLAEESAVTITLESTVDPYLYLREGEAKSGDFLHENDDIVLVTNTNSEIQETLAAGTYTIEATTYGFGETGSFTLTVSGLGDVTMPTPPQEPMPTDDPCRQTLSGAGASNGMWASDCESATRGGSYARYYTFTLTEAAAVTITLESDTDPYLYLREGEAKSGDAVQENDDITPGTDTNSQIQGTLVAGTYTIEATTYSSGETGSFTLTTSGW